MSALLCSHVLLTDANDSEWCCCWCRCTRDCVARWILKFMVLLARWLAQLNALPSPHTHTLIARVHKQTDRHRLTFKLDVYVPGASLCYEWISRRRMAHHTKKIWHTQTQTQTLICFVCWFNPYHMAVAFAVAILMVVVLLVLVMVTMVVVVVVVVMLFLLLERCLSQFRIPNMEIWTVSSHLFDLHTYKCTYTFTPQVGRLYTVNIRLEQIVH